VPPRDGGTPRVPLRRVKALLRPPACNREDLAFWARAMRRDWTVERLRLHCPRAGRV